ncbi:MAG: hypothetical protein AB4062_04155 [Crocosphaera sp.]
MLNINSISSQKKQNKNIQDLNNKTKVLVDIPVGKDKKSLIRTLLAHWTQTENKKVLFVVPYKFLLEEHKQNLSENPNLKITYTTILYRKTDKTLDGFTPDLVVLDEIGRTFSLVTEKISGKNTFEFSLFLERLMPYPTTPVIGLVTSPLKKSHSLLNIFEILIDSDLVKYILSRQLTF